MRYLKFKKQTTIHALAERLSDLERQKRFQYGFQLLDRIGNLQSQKPQRNIVAENGNQQKLSRYFVKMDIFFFSLMKQQRKLIFADNLGHCADSAEIAGRQGRQRINIMLLFPIIQVGDDVAGHIDQKNTADPIFNKILLQNILYSIELFLTQCVRQLPLLNRMICDLIDWLGALLIVLQRTCRFPWRQMGLKRRTQSYCFRRSETDIQF
jgi:hypothetical protein